MPYSPSSDLCPVKARASSPRAFMSIGKTPAVWAESSKKSNLCFRQKTLTTSSGIKSTTHIGSVQQYHRFGVGPHQLIQLIGQQLSLFAARHPGKRHADVCQLSERAHECIVLHCADQHMIPWPPKTLFQKIKRPDNIHGKNGIRRTVKMKSFSQHFSCFQYHFGNKIYPKVFCTIYITYSI